MLYVSKAGDDTTGTGSLDQPYLTITKANTEATASAQWDKVSVGAGTYAEADQIALPRGNLEYIGVGTVSLDQNLYSANGDYITYDNFTFTGDHGPQLYHAALGYYTGCTIRNIIARQLNVTRCDLTAISNIAIDNFTSRGMYIWDSHGSTVTNAHVHDAVGVTIQYCFEAEQDADNVVYTDCWAFDASHGFIDKTSTGVEYHNCVASRMTNYGFYGKGAPNGVMDHCVTYDNANGILLADNAGVPPFSTGWSITNCVIANNTIGIYIKTGAEVGLVSDYNCFFGNGSIGRYQGVNYATLAEWQAATGLDLHSVVVDPGYTDVNYGGFELPAGNALIGAGSDGGNIGLE